MEAVDWTAAVASELAGDGISANVIAGYYHDHVFVSSDHADWALRLLEAISARRFFFSAFLPESARNGGTLRLQFLNHEHVEREEIQLASK